MKKEDLTEAVIGFMFSTVNFVAGCLMVIFLPLFIPIIYGSGLFILTCILMTKLKRCEGRE